MSCRINSAVEPLREGRDLVPSTAADTNAPLLVAEEEEDCHVSVSSSVAPTGNRALPSSLTAATGNADDDGKKAGRGRDRGRKR